MDTKTVTKTEDKKEKKPFTKEKITVVKTNVTIVPFEEERIQKALEMAFRETKKVGKEAPFPKEFESILDSVSEKIVHQLIKLAQKGTCLTVEGIQDFVEVSLMKQGYHDVARDYIIYRDLQKLKRENSPQNLKIYRHDKTTQVRFNPMKLTLSIERCFQLAHTKKTEEEVLEGVNLITKKVIQKALETVQKGESLFLDSLQNWIETELMKNLFFEEAKAFILQRAEKEAKHEKLSSFSEKETEKQFVVLTKEGKKTVTEGQIRAKFRFACRGLEKEVDVEGLVKTSLLSFYEGMKEKELDLCNIFAARSKIEKDPAYSKVSSRLLLDQIYQETFGMSFSDPSLEKAHKNYFSKYIKNGISLQKLSPKLLDFDLEKIASALLLERDDLFQYLGLQTLYDRYFIHHEEKRLETPQIFWMRVAMGLSLLEENKTEKAIEFYHVLSSFLFVSSTPTLFNAGTLHSQLSSCYLSTVEDDLSSIFKIISDDAQLSKWAGGIGNDWTSVRATGSRIKGTNGKSQGVIPFLKVANDTAVAVNQCFAPHTAIFTSKGIKQIQEVQVGDLVLGISGRYREVQEKFAYNQHGPMLFVDIKHAVYPIEVTDGHPFYAIQNVPLEQSIQKTQSRLEKKKIHPAWTEAKELKKGDYIAQVIPKEVVPVEEFTEEDARLYGILLGDGQMTQNEMEWGVSGNPQVDAHLEFVRTYLRERGIHFWETSRGSSYLQIRFASGREALKDGATGRIVSRGAPTLPFEYEDLYNEKKEKRIAPRLSHLPEKQTRALLQGLLETEGNVSRGKEIFFSTTSYELAFGLRYQALRLGVPSSGNFRVRKNGHQGVCSDETKSYDICLPAEEKIALSLKAKPLTKKNWFIHEGHLFSRVKSVKAAPMAPFVYDLLVEGDKSYMTDSALVHNGGKRKGAMCAYLETWHLDIEDFLELRKNTGDERRRTHDMNTANWIPDLFMKRVLKNEMWTLFDPAEVPDLHDLYGKAFEERYSFYEKLIEEGKIKLFKKIEAVKLWRKMLSMLFETGHPWITFKDPSNIRSPQDHVGVVHSSNLCTEILLNTSKEETAVCNLGSINLSNHVNEEGIEEEKLASTIRSALRMLDNVIDINFYPIEEAKNANLRHRPVGLGIMGFQDALYKLGYSYASHEAVEFADTSMEMISYYAILASTELAKERGPYESFTGSKWDRGLLPIDTLSLLEKERGEKIEVDTSSKMDWGYVRQKIKERGMRNSNTMAIAPTATIANITGLIPSIEPAYKHLYVKSNLSGEFTIINPFLVKTLKEKNLWDEEMVDDLKYFDGSIQEIERIPTEIKMLFVTAFEVEPEWLIKCASRRQKWLDMGQSLNLYLNQPSGKKIDHMYQLSWKSGLKTTYYLRSMAATQIEKSTLDINKGRSLQPRWMKNKSASDNIKVTRDTPKVCNLEEGCESCQ